jgi:hypothetical protein
VLTGEGDDAPTDSVEGERSQVLGGDRFELKEGGEAFGHVGSM